MVNAGNATDVAIDSAKQIIDKEDMGTTVRCADEMTGNETDFATNPVNQAISKANKENTAINFKSGINTITIGQYLGENNHYNHFNRHTHRAYAGVNDLHNTNIAIIRYKIRETAKDLIQ